MGEIWKPITGYDGYYVSNYGRVKTTDRVCKRKNGVSCKLKGKILKGGDNGLGYKKVVLVKDGIKTLQYVHRIVASEFIPRPDGKDYVNHKDCNPGNNNVDNLEWVTFQENLDYAKALGRCDVTEERRKHLFEGQRSRFRAVVGTNMLTGDTVYCEWLNGVREYGFNPPDVHRCCNGKRTHAGGYVWRYADEVNNPRR